VDARERARTLRRLLKACSYALARLRDAPDAARSPLAADVERLRERAEAELRELESDSRSTS
jgi:hypothetical protein